MGGIVRCTQTFAYIVYIMLSKVHERTRSISSTCTGLKKQTVKLRPLKLARKLDMSRKCDLCIHTPSLCVSNRRPTETRQERVGKLLTVHCKTTFATDYFASIQKKQPLL